MPHEKHCCKVTDELPWERSCAALLDVYYNLKFVLIEVIIHYGLCSLLHKIQKYVLNCSNGRLIIMKSRIDAELLNV